MSTSIKPTYQIQRINALENQLETWQSLSLEQFRQRPNEKAWSAIEVAKHIVLAHDVYREKVAAAQNNSTKMSWPQSEYVAKGIPSFLIKRFPPKEGAIKWKMKTMKVFRPVLVVETLSATDTRQILVDLKARLQELKSWVEAYRTASISLKKFNSALGPMVRFTIPEACEFILCHNERHFLQLQRALN